MAVLAANFTDAVYARVTGDSTFNTSVGGTAILAGRVRYGQAQPEETAPYAVFMIVDQVDDDTFLKSGVTTRFQFDIYSPRADGPRAALAIYDKLIARLDRVQLSVSSHKVTRIWLDIMRGPLPDDEFWRVSADFLMTGFES